MWDHFTCGKIREHEFRLPDNYNTTISLKEKDVSDQELEVGEPVYFSDLDLGSPRSELKLLKTWKPASSSVSSTCWSASSLIQLKPAQLVPNGFRAPLQPLKRYHQSLDYQQKLSLSNPYALLKSGELKQFKL
jgi:hypothetical protein